MNGNAGLVFIARFKMANCKFSWLSCWYISKLSSKINFENHETSF